jgi:hypothetical protein
MIAGGYDRWDQWGPMGRNERHLRTSYGAIINGFAVSAIVEGLRCSAGNSSCSCAGVLG